MYFIFTRYKSFFRELLNISYRYSVDTLNGFTPNIFIFSKELCKMSDYIYCVTGKMIIMIQIPCKHIFINIVFTEIMKLAIRSRLRLTMTLGHNNFHFNF